jgi:hypothetical protein
MATDFTKSAQQILIDLINATNATAITSADVTFSNMAPTGGGNRNTGIRVTAVANSGYLNHVDVTYDRVDLAQIPGSRPVVFNLGSVTSAFGLLPAINAAYGINLTTDDVEDDPMPTFHGDPLETEPFTLRAKSGSLIYRGSLSLTIDGNDIDLATLITVTELNGLVYPTF